MAKIDSHQHFWRYSSEEYGWIDEDMSALRRDFLPADLPSSPDGSGYEGFVAIQARQTDEENEFLLGLAHTSPRIWGVVGWVDLRSPNVAGQLARLSADPLFVGVRHIVQAEPTGFMDGEEFRRGISQLARHGLTYDVLVYRDQLPEAVDLCQAFPDQAFVLDHCAKPDIRGRDGHAAWVRDIRRLSRCKNVYCKLSGLTFEADWETWDADTLRPYTDHALACFGAKRCMVGSDWPVSLVAGSHAQTLDAIESLLEDLSPTERDQVLGGTASRFYKLGPTAPE